MAKCESARRPAAGSGTMRLASDKGACYLGSECGQPEGRSWRGLSPVTASGRGLRVTGLKSQDRPSGRSVAKNPSPDKKPRLVASAQDSMSARRSGRHDARCHPGLWVQQDNIRSNMETPTESTPHGSVRSYTDKAFHKVANTRNVPTEASLKK